jgi:uncharacterized membrane protein
MTGNVVALGFDDQSGAEAMLNDLNRWQEEGIIEIEDAVIASAGPDGTVKIQETHRSEKGKFAVRGGGVGLVAGVLLGGPILGLVAGVTAGVLKGKKKDKAYGLDDDFVEGASAWVRAGHSALFLLVKQADAEQLEIKLRPLRAKILSTSLEPERERRLRQALAEEEYGS